MQQLHDAMQVCVDDVCFIIRIATTTRTRHHACYDGRHYNYDEYCNDDDEYCYC